MVLPINAYGNVAKLAGDAKEAGIIGNPLLGCAASLTVIVLLDKILEPSGFKHGMTRLPCEAKSVLLMLTKRTKSFEVN